MAEMVDDGELDVRGKDCLELGAGAALPSLLAALVRTCVLARFERGSNTIDRPTPINQHINTTTERCAPGRGH